MNSWNHAQSAARQWGGTPEDYIKIEEWIDGSKRSVGDVRHRALFHHAEGIWVCQDVFGHTLEIPKAHGHGYHAVPVRMIAEKHILEDLGWIPSFRDYIDGMPIKSWMSGSQRKEVPLSHLLKGAA